MRKINKICRFPFAVVFSIVFAIVVYFMTVVSMIFCNWDVEFESIQTIHKDVATLYQTVMGNA